MTLSALRHLVLAGNLVAVTAAGGAGWYAYNLDVEVREAKEWKKMLPATGAAKAERSADVPGGIQGYNEVIGWAQGVRPVKEEPKETKKEVVKVDPFKTLYSLRNVMVCPTDAFKSWVVMQDKSNRGFDIGVGSYAPKNPFPGKDEETQWTAWRLDKAWIESKPGRKFGERQIRHLAHFINDENGDTKTFEMDLSNDGYTADPLSGHRITDRSREEAFENKPFRGKLLKRDLEAENPVIEWELPEEETRWLVEYSDKEAQKLGFDKSNTDDDGDGKPDGFVIKSLTPDSRAARLGMKAEDRVISVNDEKVNSNEQAIDKGKRDYDAGKSTFKVQVDRQGKILNFTFHAKKGKGKKGGKGDGRRPSR